MCCVCFKAQVSQTPGACSKTETYTQVKGKSCNYKTSFLSSKVFKYSPTAPRVWGPPDTVHQNRPGCASWGPRLRRSGETERGPGQVPVRSSHTGSPAFIIDIWGHGVSREPLGWSQEKSEGCQAKLGGHLTIIRRNLPHDSAQRWRDLGVRNSLYGPDNLFYFHDSQETTISFAFFLGK